MKVLIIGSGGREHALAWKVAQSPRVTQVYVAPGNAGTALEPRAQNVDVAADDVPALLRFAQQHEPMFIFLDEGIRIAKANGGLVGHGYSLISGSVINIFINFHCQPEP